MLKISEYIEHTLLRPDAKAADFDQLAQEARQYHFLGVCVPPYWVKKVKKELSNTSVKVITVVGFPLGYHLSSVKAFEAVQAIKDGADEIDLVINISAVKSEAMPEVRSEIATIAALCHEHDILLKTIIETAYFSQEKIKSICSVCAEAGSDFIKTSTGFAHSGAKIEDIQCIKNVIPENIGIKASGGIKTLDQARAFINAGANRLGTSSGVSIMQEFFES